MLAPALRRHGGDGAFHDLQQRLLHALARHVARDRRVVGLAADLVDLVDVDNATLGAFDVVVGRLEQLEDDVFHILTDIPRLGQRGRVGHRERNVENPRQCLRQQGLAGAGRPAQQDVRFRQLDVIVLRRVTESLVVVVHRDGQDALGLVLANHIIVEDRPDFLGRRHPILGLHQGGLALLTDDVHAEFDAFIADEYSRTGNPLPDLVLALTAETAVQGVAGIAPGLGGWHVVNVPPLGEPAGCGLARKTMLNAPYGSPQPQNMVCRRATWEQLLATA